MKIFNIDFQNRKMKELGEVEDDSNCEKYK